MALVAAAGYRVAALNTTELIRDKADLVIASIEARTHGHLDPVRAQLEYLADLLTDEALDPGGPRPEDLGPLLRASLAAVPQVSAVAFVDPALRVLRAFRDPHPGRPAITTGDWSDAPGFRRAMARARRADRAFWGPLFVAEGTGTTLINLFVPVRDPADDRFAGALVAGVSIGELSRFLGAMVRGRRVPGEAFVLRGRRAVLAHRRLRDGFPGLSDEHPLPDLDELGDPVLREIWSPERVAGLEADFATGDGRDVEARVVEARVVEVAGVGGDGRRVVFLFDTLEGYGEEPWIVGTYLPLDEAAPQLGRLGDVLWTAPAVLLAALAAALVLGRAITRPIRARAAAAARVRALDLADPPRPARGAFRELNEAVDAFGAMTEGLRAFATYVPRPLVRRLVREGDHGALPSEEREVTILFSDLAGFTALAEDLPAAEIAAFLNRHFTLIGRCVEAEGGTVDKYIGDALMAFWGAPEGQPDHAGRAARAALAIARAVRRDNQAARATALPGAPRPLRVRIGVHSGRVVVGNIGAPSRVNYTVVGDAVNTAERLEELAREVAGDGDEACILLSADTARRLGPDFPLAPLGERALRGRHGPLEVFRLLP